jgi:hypothetical protein
VFYTDSLPNGNQPPGRFVVSVAKWSGGWDLYIDGDGLNSGGGVTQVASLEDADAQVRNYLTALFQTDFSDAVIDIALPTVDDRLVTG